MVKSPDLQISVGVAFERRLAELVWEHCPELARQTAAGRMALAIDVSNPDTIEAAERQAVQEAVSQLVGTMVELNRPRLEGSDIVDRVVSDVKEKLEEKLGAIRKKLDGMIDDSVEKTINSCLTSHILPKVRDASAGLFRERPLARRVHDQLNVVIKEYLSSKLEPEKSDVGVLTKAEAKMSIQTGKT